MRNVERVCFGKSRCECLSVCCRRLPVEETLRNKTGTVQFCGFCVYTDRTPGTWGNPEQRLLPLSGMNMFISGNKRKNHLDNMMNIQ